MRAGPSHFCLRCLRPLRVPESVQRGYGPECWKMIMNERKVKIMTQDMPAFADLIVMKRIPDGMHQEAITNVPWLVKHHSPTGFEWSYGGSGPADLALNILENILILTNFEGPRVDCWEGNCFEAAWALHQEFKWEFIAPMQKQGGNLKTSMVHHWIRAKIKENEL